MPGFFEGASISVGGVNLTIAKDLNRLVEDVGVEGVALLVARHMYETAPGGVFPGGVLTSLVKLWPYEGDQFGRLHRSISRLLVRHGFRPVRSPQKGWQTPAVFPDWDVPIERAKARGEGKEEQKKVAPVKVSYVCQSCTSTERFETRAARDKHEAAHQPEGGAVDETTTFIHRKNYRPGMSAAEALDTLTLPQKALYDVIVADPGQRAQVYVRQLGSTHKRISSHLKALRKKDLIHPRALGTGPSNGVVYELGPGPAVPWAANMSRAQKNRQQPVSGGTLPQTEAQAWEERVITVRRGNQVDRYIKIRGELFKLIRVGEISV